MPTQVLMQYKQNPTKQAVDGMPMDMLAGLELSRRAQLQQEQMAKMAPNPQQMPTVVDQAAMGLAGMAQQPAPQMPGAPMQFQAAPQAPQAAPQPAPQQVAPQPQAPQAAAPAPAPQQAPQKLAVGGIASLGDMQGMQDAQDQNGLTGLYGGGQPVQMMAHGGAVAFDDGGSVGDPTGTGASDIANAPTGEDDGRNLLERLLGVPAEPKWKRESRAQQEVARAEAGVKPSPSDGPVKPSDIAISQGGGNNMDAILRQLTGGGGGGFDASKMQALIDRYMKPTQAETDYQTTVKEEMDRIRNRQSPEVSEADRKRIIDEQFQQNQAISRPYYEQMQKMIDEERAATKARFADKDADAMIRAGLHGLSARKPGMTGFFEGVTQGMDYHDKMSELEAAANSKSRQAQMDLVKARMSDEKGDREAAQRYFDSYQRNRREAEAYEVQRSNMLIAAQKGIVDTEGKRERAGMAMQLGLERAQAGAENAALRNQMGLMRLMQGSQPKPLTVNEKLALEKRVGEVFGNPASPEFQKYVGSAANGKQLLMDLKNGRIKPDNPQFQAIVEQAKRRYMNDMVSGTRSSSGVTSYDQASSDLLGQ